MQSTTYSHVETWQTDIDNNRPSDDSDDPTTLTVHTNLGLVTGSEPGRQIVALAVSGDFVELVTTTLQSGPDGLYWEIPEDVTSRLATLGDEIVQTWYWFENTDPSIDYDSLDSPVDDIVSENIENIESKWLHITQYELYYNDNKRSLSGKVNIPAYPVQHHFEIEPDDELKLVVVDGNGEDGSIEKFEQTVRKNGKVTIPKDQREALGLSQENRVIELWAQLGDILASDQTVSKQSPSDNSASNENTDNSDVSTATITFSSDSEPPESAQPTTESSVTESEPDADSSSQAETASETVGETEQRSTDELSRKPNPIASEPAQANEGETTSTVTKTVETNTVDSQYSDDSPVAQTVNTTSIQDVIDDIDTDETVAITDIDVEMNPDSEPVVLLDDSERLREKWPLHYQDPNGDLFCGRDYTNAVTDYARDHGTAVCVDCLLERPGTLSAADIVAVLETFTDITLSPSFPIVLDKEDSAAVAATLTQLGLHKTE